MTKPLMEFQILIQKGKISRLESPYGKAVVIPFEGYVSSELFTGRILPGAADVQTTDAAGIRHMCAKYMFEGTDSSGRFCHLFVENNGYFEKDSHPEIFHACPSFLSDSPVLSEKLSGPWFRAEGHPSDAGVVIKIFDVREAEEEISYPPLRKGKDPALIRDELAETYESLSEERKRFVSEAAERIGTQGEISQAVFYNEKDAGTYVYDPERDGGAAGDHHQYPAGHCFRMSEWFSGLDYQHSAVHSHAGNDEYRPRNCLHGFGRYSDPY